MTDAPEAVVEPALLDAAVLDRLLDEEMKWQLEHIRRRLVVREAIEVAEEADKALAEVRSALAHELNRWRNARLGPGSRSFHLS